MTSMSDFLIAITIFEASDSHEVQLSKRVCLKGGPHCANSGFGERGRRRIKRLEGWGASGSLRVPEGSSTTTDAQAALPKPTYTSPFHKHIHALSA